MKQIHYFVEIVANYSGGNAKLQARELTDIINETLQSVNLITGKLECQPQLIMVERQKIAVEDAKEK